MVHTEGAKSVSVYALIQSNLFARILVIRLQRLHNVGETTELVGPQLRQDNAKMQALPRCLVSSRG